MPELEIACSVPTATSPRAILLCWPLATALAGKLTALALMRHNLPAGLALFFASGGVVLYHLFAPKAGGFVPSVTRFITARREVWLTFDDGPDPQDTPQLLALLARYNAQAAFFVIGERAARHPELIAALLAAGHEVHHHTHTHPVGTFWCASAERVATELDDGLTALRRAGVQPRYFRPPAGIKNLFLQSALERRGLRGVTWSIRSGDCYAASAEAVVARVMARVAPGAIILLHEGRSAPDSVRVAAAALLLEKLTAAGYRCVNPPASSLR
jgi:peptidoglycan/xylan/chitin deacetylase (PgdA/CDA1 family)